MTYARSALIESLDTLPRMPSWVTLGHAESPEHVAFLSGAALNHLHVLMGHSVVPQALLRERLALRAAEACVTFSGRSERARDLRDAVHLLRPGDLPGPAGVSYIAWRRAAERPVSVMALTRAVPTLEQDQIAMWLDAGQGSPVCRATMVLETVLTNAPRGELWALILADAALAHALSWDYLVPLLAQGLSRADLGKRGEDLRLACHRAVVSSAAEAVRLSADLACRTAHLKTVTPKLRAKAAKDSVEIFLTRDAVSPSALPLPDRAARRLCDRLIDLCAVRELTGRETFRIYGV